jgi:hypothetical protein
MPSPNKHKQLLPEESLPSAKKHKSLPYKVVECWDWRQTGGNCPRGEKCTFAHRSLSPTPSEAAYQINSKNAPLCKFFQSGNCLRGDSCPFSHTLPTQIPCKYFVARGFCSNQEKCKYAHVRVDESERQRIVEEFNAYQKYPRTIEEKAVNPSVEQVKNVKPPTPAIISNKHEILTKPMLQIFYIPSFFPPSLEQTPEEKLWIQEAIARYKPFTSPF